MTLAKLAGEVLHALAGRASAKQRWLDILSGDAGDAQEALWLHLAADDSFEALLAQLVDLVRTRQKSGFIQLDLETLSD